MLVCRHTGGSRRGLTHRKRPRGCPGVYLGGLFESLDVLLSSGGLDPPDTHALRSRMEGGQSVVKGVVKRVVSDGHEVEPSTIESSRKWR